MKLFSDEILGLFDPIEININSFSKRKKLFNTSFIYHLLLNKLLILDARYSRGLNMTSNLIGYSKKELVEQNFVVNKLNLKRSIQIDFYIPKNGNFDVIESNNLIFLGRGFVGF